MSTSTVERGQGMQERHLVLVDVPRPARPERAAPARPVHARARGVGPRQVPAAGGAATCGGAGGPVTRGAGARDSAATPRPAALRLTRRGRSAVVLVACLLLLAAFALAPFGPWADTEPPARGPAPTMVVEPGDTLWAIAQRVAPGRDPRVMVERLRRLNNLDTPALTPGQTLVLPRPGSG